MHRQFGTVNVYEPLPLRDLLWRARFVMKEKTNKQNLDQTPAHLSARGSVPGTDVCGDQDPINIDLLVNEPCHCFGSRRRHRKWPVPSKVRISTCATYNLPPSRRWGSGKLALLMNDDNSIWCYQCNHAMSSRTILIRAHVHC